MKKMFIMSLVISFLLGINFAVGAMVKTEETKAMSKMDQVKKMTYQGTIIDNLCAESSEKNLPKFIKTHTKECALMPSCVASGYSLYVKGKLIPFDQDSNKKIEMFLKNKDSSLDVTVEAQNENNRLKLITIKNKKK